MKTLIKYYQKYGMNKTITKFGISKSSLYRLLKKHNIQKYNICKIRSWYDTLPANEEEYQKKWSGYKKDTSWLKKYCKYDMNEVC